MIEVKHEAYLVLHFSLIEASVIFKRHYYASLGQSLNWIENFRNSRCALFFKFKTPW